MKFIVHDLAAYWSEEPPLPSCKKEVVYEADCRTCKSPEEFASRGLGNWFSTGIDHGYWDYQGKKGIVRYQPSTEWVLEVHDVGELLDLARERKDTLQIDFAPEDRLPTLTIGRS